jgi:DNA-binding transcriptional regulator YiaG
MSTRMGTNSGRTAAPSPFSHQRAMTTPNTPRDDGFASWLLTNYSTSPGREPNFGYIIAGGNQGARALFHEDEWTLQEVGKPESAQVVAQALDTADDIHWFRQALELGMGDIAALFGVTRKSVYDWLDGTQTGKAAYIKAVRSLIEQELDAQARPYLPHFWESGPEGSVPLLDILKSGDAARIGADAKQALRALKRPIIDYVESIRSEASAPSVAHTYNHDEYRSL